MFRVTDLVYHGKTRKSSPPWDTGLRDGLHGQLARGAEARIPWGNHKSTVLSLKEIADGLVDATVLQEVDLPAVQQPKMELEALDPSFDL